MNGQRPRRVYPLLMAVFVLGLVAGLVIDVLIFAKADQLRILP